MIIFIERHLADTDFEIFRIRNLTIHFKGKVGIVEVRRAVTFRPPQARVFHLQLREVFDIENDRLLFSRRQGNRLLECDISDLAFQHTVYRIGIVVLHDHLGCQGRRSRIG